ncbi:MAG TPA: hypothetical protein VG295_07965 [Solirubrobacteraceae bacterium]|nr:hypothetical protein [Solirubrobacteraceae bacterium]
MKHHDPYCDRSAALGEGFPNLVGGVVGLGVGLVRGSVLAVRNIAEQAIWMDPAPGWPGGQRCCGPVHHVVISDCGPCGCSCCR